VSSAYSWIDQDPILPLPANLPEPPPAAQRESLASVRARLGPAAANLLSATELISALEKVRHDESVLSGVPVLDELLGGGLSRGKLTELAGRTSAGRFSVTLSALASVTSLGEASALVDLGDHLDPQSAQADGVDLSRLLWIRPRRLKDAVASAEMLLATGFQLVIVDLGLHPVPGPRVADAAWVRLARSAAAQGSVLLISTPYPITRTAAEASVSAQQSRGRWQGSANMPRLLVGTSSRLTLEKHRHMRAGTTRPMSFTVHEAIRESYEGGRRRSDVSLKEHTVSERIAAPHSNTVSR